MNSAFRGKEGKTSTDNAGDVKEYKMSLVGENQTRFEYNLRLQWFKITKMRGGL